MWWIPIAHASPCDLAPALAALEEAALDGRADAPARIEAVEAALGCGPVADPAAIARLFWAEAVVARTTGDEEGADLALAAAGRLDPEPPEVFGRALAARRAELPEAAPATLAVEPLGRYQLYVDGLPSTSPATVAGGLHVVQLAAAEAPAVYGRVVLAAPGERTRVVPVLPPEPPEPLAAPPLPLPAPLPLPEPPLPVPVRRSLAPYVVSGASAAGALVLAGLAEHQSVPMRAAETLDELDRAYTAQKVFVGSSLTLAGVAVASLLVR